MTKTSMILPDQEKVSWDWDVGEKKIVSTTYCSTQFEWIEEFQVSPDGEKIAMVAKVGGFEFSVCEKGDIWDPPYEKIWQLGYSPDGRLAGLVAQDGEWTVAVDGQTWDETYGFLWDTMFSGDGKVIAVAAQQDMTYGMVVDGKPWKQFFENANQFALSRKGDKSAAVVQTKSFAQADIQAFQNGCYTIAVDGEPWKRNFVNAWTPVFSPDGNRVAAQVRTSLYDYTVAVDSQTWAQGYTGVWTPLFSPEDGAVVAPVRERGKWGMARNGEFIWEPTFDQCWHQCFSDDGQNLWAIVAPKFGHFTLAQNGQPWKTCFPVVTDLIVGPTGTRAAALAKDDKDQWTIITDDTPWPGTYAMAWPAVFSPDGNHLIAKVEQNGKYTFVLDGREWNELFDQAWDPVFSPEGDKIMLRYIKDDAYFRRVVRLEDFKG
jgi:hypothetical protein